MPLFIDISTNKILFNDLKLVNEYRQYFDIEKELFLKKSDELVKTLDYRKFLYVGQREYATVRYDDEFIDFIGSHDATTCHIVLIVDQLNNNCSLCHFDGSFVNEGIEDMINSLKKLHIQNQNIFNYDLYITGGFIENKNYSKELTNEIFEIFKSRNENFYVKLFCCTELNDEIKENGIHFPIIYGFTFNIKTKEIFKTNDINYKGPDGQARSARHFVTNKNMNIYDTNTSRLIIGPFDYKAIEYAEYIYNKPDSFILKYFSTSPAQEPKDFVNNFKKTLEIMINHPNPLVTYFKNNPKIYKRVEGKLEWQQINN